EPDGPSGSRSRSVHALQASAARGPDGVARPAVLVRALEPGARPPAGGVEGLGREGKPSRPLIWDEVVAWQPEVVVIACCGYNVARTLRDLPLVRSVLGWRELPAVRSGRVY